jgi:hypothetical protein
MKKIAALLFTLGFCMPLSAQNPKTSIGSAVATSIAVNTAALDNPGRQRPADGYPPGDTSPPVSWADDLLGRHILSVGFIGFVVALLSRGLFHAFALARDARQQARREEKIVQLEQKVDSTPDKVKPVWELARFTLENYFQRNLTQVKAIYTVSIMVMIAGFGVIVIGIIIAVSDPNRIKIALIASASGIITEFISLTFMIIYRLTMAQANEYVAVLERINTVGMTIQILYSMADGATDLKDATRADIIRILLNTTSVKASPELRRKKRTEKKTR